MRQLPGQGAGFRCQGDKPLTYLPFTSCMFNRDAQRSAQEFTADPTEEGGILTTEDAEEAQPATG